MKVGQSDVAGASGAPDKGKVAGASGAPEKDATQVGGAADAAKGAKQVGGGGGTDLASVLEALTAAVKSLAEVVSKMGTSGGGGAAGGCGSSGCGGAKAKVAGVQGGAATEQQYVAKPEGEVRAAKSEDDDFEQRVLELINKERSKSGLAPVSYHGALDNAAEKHAKHMSIVGRMAHDGIGDGDPGERIRSEGWRRGWGENVATGQQSPEQVVREWMNSPTHRKNILDPSFRSMGVGLSISSNGRTYWAQEFGS